MPYTISMEFVETPIFSKLINQYLDDMEYSALQWYLIQNPEKGDIIPQSGGLRKIRWKIAGKGKRGGIRIIYYYKNSLEQIWLLTVYAKNEQANIPIKLLKELSKELYDG